MVARKTSFFVRIWKSMKSFIAVITVLLTISFAGYVVAAELNSYAKKEDITELVTVGDLKEMQETLQQSIDITNKRIDDTKIELKKDIVEVKEDVRGMNEKIFDIYDVLINKPSKNKK